jgi:ribosomal protein L37AE/L43A
MFLAGKKSVIIKEDIAQELTCPSCKSKNSTSISIIGMYKHLFQIPFLSGGKTGVSKCKKCSEEYALSKMPSLIKLAYFESKETAKTPIWFYTGLITVKVLVLFKIFSKYY